MLYRSNEKFPLIKEKLLKKDTIILYPFKKSFFLTEDKDIISNSELNLLNKNDYFISRSSRIQIWYKKKDKYDDERIDEFAMEYPNFNYEDKKQIKIIIDEQTKVLYREVNGNMIRV